MIKTYYIINGFATIGLVFSLVMFCIILIEFYSWVKTKICMKTKIWQMFGTFCVYYDDFQKYMKDQNYLYGKYHNMEDKNNDKNNI